MHGGGVTFVGESAVAVYQATVLKSAIRMMKRGMKPNRAYTWKAVAHTVSRITGQKFTGKKDADAMMRALDEFRDRTLPNATIIPSNGAP